MHDAAALVPGLLVVVVALTIVTVALAAFRVLDQTDRFIGDRLAEALAAGAAEAAESPEPRAP
jgi:Tfp pilus assembly protein PilX